MALNEVDGFKWITHLANYSDFPRSLAVICVFDTDNNLTSAVVNRKDDYLRSLIGEKLFAADIHIKDIRQLVSFDTEQACENENWRKVAGALSGQ